jgi:hypothetical protein
MLVKRRIVIEETYIIDVSNEKTAIQMLKRGNTTNGTGAPIYHPTNSRIVQKGHWKCGSNL